MKLATYNIRLGIQEGLDAIAKQLDDCDADIVTLQEVGRHWIMGPGGDSTRYLAKACGYDHFLFVPAIALASGPAQYGHAVLSRYPLTQARVHALTQAVDEPRRVLVVGVQAPHPFTLISTHLSHIQDRAAQLDEVYAHLTEGPWVLMGDLNAEPGSLGSLDDVGSFADVTQKTFPSDAPRQRIDHIVVHAGTLDSVGTFGTSAASDHLGVQATWRS